MFAEGPGWQPEGEAAQCEQCGQEPASVHVVRVESGDITQAHLCQECAGEMAQQSGGPALVFALPLSSGGVAGADRSPTGEAATVRPSIVCPTCGTTFTDLRETGLLGCAACYRVFAEHLVRPSLGIDAPEGALHHQGKVPNRAAEGLRERREVLRLSRMLRELVETERFEEAAGVRDRLAELGHDRWRGVL